MPSSLGHDSSGATVDDRIPLLVGVVGHRDLARSEVAAIRTAIRDLLHALKATEPDMRVQLLSPMAEGADLIAAEVATELGLTVIALLPFPIEDCRAELAGDDTRASFDAILERAECLVLPQPDEQAAIDSELRERQFDRAGALVAMYSTVLIAVWDGIENDHPAGTARTIALRRGRASPLAEDRSHDPDALLFAEDNDLMYEIRCSRAADEDDAVDTRPSVIGFTTGDRYFGDIDDGIPEPVATLLARTAAFNRDVEQRRDDIAREGRSLASAGSGPLPPALGHVDGLFVAADWLSVHFRRCFTRALAARYTLWALMAFLLLAFDRASPGKVQLASMAGVLIVFGAGWALAVCAARSWWDRRYLDYRALAEGLRVQYYWELAGVRSRFDSTFAHESFLQKQDYEFEWIRAAMRSVSLRCELHPQPASESGFEQAVSAWLGDPDRDDGVGQLPFYRRRSAVLERRGEITERSVRALLIGGLALAVLLAVDTAMSLAQRPLLGASVRGLLLWVFALLTVYGALLEIYFDERADRALIRQYRHMYRLFRFAVRELRSARSRSEKLNILRSLGRACLAEHALWLLSQRGKRVQGMHW